MFFDLIDVALVNSDIVYTKLSNYIPLMNFKIFVTKALIGKCSNCGRSLFTSRPSKQKSYETSLPREIPNPVSGEANEMSLLQ